MGYIRIDGITFVSTPASMLMAQIDYKLASDPDSAYVTWTTTLVQTDGSISPSVTITGLVTGQPYSVRVTMTCGGVSFIAYALASAEVTTTTTTTTTAAPITTTTTSTTAIPTTTTTTTTAVPVLVWAEGETVCETAGALQVRQDITGVSTPAVSWYDEVNGFVYIADNDDMSGNVYWFDPNTATVEGDMIHSTQIQHDDLYGAAIDPDYRRIYFVGRDSGGLISYNIDTDTATTVAYGTNGINFSRLTVDIISNKIYATDKITPAIAIFNRATLALESTVPISSIPNNARFGIGGYQMFEVGSEIWIVAGSGSSVSSVGIYNQTLTTNIANIALPGAVVWDGGKYWQKLFYDEISGQVYVSDFGSGMRYVIDPVTRTILNSRSATNRSGKSAVQHYWSKHPITTELLCSIHESNSTTDSAIVTRVYTENRSTFQYEDMLIGYSYYSLVPVTGTSMMISVYTGLPGWTSIPAALTDGVISILDYDPLASNTGMKITLTLEEIDENTGNPTGNTKPNVIEDPDYIPPVEDFDTCPLTYGLQCPSMVATGVAGQVQYEFSVLDSVLQNPSVDSIVLRLKSGFTVVDATTFSLPHPDNYFNGIFTAGAGSYTLEVQYLDVSSTVLATCSGLASFTIT